MLIIRHIDRRAMTHQLKYRCVDRTMRFALIMLLLIIGLLCECFAQLKPSMKVKLNVFPSVNIARMDIDLHSLFAEDIAHLNELVSAKTGGEDPVSLDFGFSISAYENITVILSFTSPELSERNKNSLYSMRIDCGYLNDGTTYFRRATITNRNSMQFRLRNNNLLKRSMKLSDPLFVAYTFFLVHYNKVDIKNTGTLPVSTITLEYM
jgi:hypothetical protein